MFDSIAKLLHALNSEVAPWQIALAFVLGMVVGLTPLWSMHNLLLLLIACIIRVNFSSFLLSVALFSALAYLLDPLFMLIGEKLLLAPALYDFWRQLYQSDFWRITDFNNTITLGSLVFSLIAFIPMFFIVRFLIIKYRSRVLKWVNTLKIVQLIKASHFFTLYQKFYG